MTGPGGILAGRTVLVTGGGGPGIGRGVGDAVVEAGGRLVVHDATRAAAESAAGRWPGSIPVWGDVADEAAVDAFVTRALREAGSIDGLVNNAGVGLHRAAIDATAEQFDRLYAVDVRGTWLVTRALALVWRDEAVQGTIVNVSSVHAAATIDGYALYAGAKGAVEALTRGLAVELGPSGIRCNAIAPGYVASDQNEDLLATLTDAPALWPGRHARDQQAVARIVDRSDCGRVAAFLLSSSSAGITGQVVTVDNGTTALLYNRSFTRPAGPQ